MLNSIISCQCRDCHKEMEQINQPRFEGGYLTLITCKNPACLLRNVTLSIPQYVKMTDAQLEEYRVINRRYALAVQNA